MKKLHYLMNGLAALALTVLFSQCAGGNATQPTNDNSATANGVSGLKIAYVEVDTLLTKYNFCIDLNEEMVKKSENVRLTLNQKANDLNKQKQEFQTKYQTRPSATAAIRTSATMMIIIVFFNLLPPCTLWLRPYSPRPSLSFH